MNNLLICGKGIAAAIALKQSKEFLKSWNINYGYFLKENMKHDNLTLSRKLGIKNFEITDYQSLKEYIEANNPDYILMAQFSMIIKNDLIKLKKNKIINLHHGNLPKYRGMGPITQAILNQEDVFGCTLHFIESNVDTGRIIKQKLFSIKGLDNETVYKKCLEADKKLLSHFYKNLFNGQKLKSYAQKDWSASYYSAAQLHYSKPYINFNQSASQILAFCRAYFFPSMNLFPIIKIANSTFVALSVPSVKERCVNEPSGKIKFLNNTLYVSSKDRWLAFEIFQKNI
ncbi:formyltransferase family protein [Candidatus Methylopumilus universalis]|uniref:formyltransferase family protein n=1 Tax=Candidatus Methylopumilus universalis TaxID=2588536 RepID=UPI001123DCE9|nr:formyltransferase family protein [Candidatus Methylopumilus universalis]QDC80377.1 hypothetical protein FIT83_04180 [Candidatus Methylopumilus universalis]QDC81678.1 hypothetical protein FIT82_04245 [Candidatus Methylopumilus universalis]